MTNTTSSSDPRMRAALAEAIELGETGISVAAYHRGTLIVEGFAGESDRETHAPVVADTLFAIFSVTKGVTALAVHMQAARGHLDLSQPVAAYWPEFAAHGKQDVTVEQALAHQAGIPQMPAGVTPELLADWEWMVSRVAQHEPVFVPGKSNAYHVLVWGWILGEVVRRTDPVQGRSFADFVRNEICTPLGIGCRSGSVATYGEFYLGVPDKALPRIATLYGGKSFGMVDTYNTSPSSVFPGAEQHNLKVMRQAVDPGAGGIATATGVARIFAALANGGELDGVRLLPAESVKSLTRLREKAHDPDKVLPIPVWFGAAGYWLGGEPGVSDPLVGDHREIIYSPGAGGSLAWADLKNNIAGAICHNNMDAAMIMEPKRTFEPLVQVIRQIVAEREGK